MIKTLVVNGPRLEPHRPPPGPAIIAKVCEQQGHSVTAYDLNIKFFHYCKDRNINYHEFDGVWDQFAVMTQLQKTTLENFLDYWCKKIVDENYNFIMLSVFGMSGKTFAMAFLDKIRPLTSAKIIAGGMSIGAYGLTDSNNCFGQQLKQQNLIDTFIVGEGEVSLVKALNNETWPGVNNTEVFQIDDINSLPLPDYKFYNLGEYDYLIPNEPEVYITGSRGCVRKCTYCDVAAYWPKYRYRSGKHIANELIINYERYGIEKFYFTDSLVNGSLSAFSDMCNVLANYQYSDRIKWGGQFIFRNYKTVPPEHFEMISKAGGNTFYVGVETGSDRVRKEMGKNFTNEDIEYQLDQFHKNKLKCTFLMFPGYVTETLSDHQDTIDMMPRWQKYVASGTINGLELGSPLIIVENTPLGKRIEEYQIGFLHSDTIVTSHYWKSELNPDFDFVQRVQRQLELYEAAVHYKWPIWRFHTRAIDLQQALLNFYKTRQKNSSYKVIPIRF